MLNVRDAIGTLMTGHAVVLLLERQDLAVAGQKLDLAGRHCERESTRELRWTQRDTGLGAADMM